MIKLRPRVSLTNSVIQIQCTIKGFLIEPQHFTPKTCHLWLKIANVEKSAWNTMPDLHLHLTVSLKCFILFHLVIIITIFFSFQLYFSIMTDFPHLLSSLESHLSNNCTVLSLIYDLAFSQRRRKKKRTVWCL